jgi:hypothetical protein
MKSSSTVVDGQTQGDRARLADRIVVAAILHGRDSWIQPCRLSPQASTSEEASPIWLAFRLARLSHIVRSGPVPPDLAVKPSLQKYLYFVFAEIMLYYIRPAPETRGASRSSRTLGAGCDGLSELQRAFRERTNSSGRTAKSCGPGIPTLMPSSRAMICGRRWPKSPVHRGEPV